MKNAKEILEQLSPFWDKYVRNHDIKVKKEEALFRANGFWHRII